MKCDDCEYNDEIGTLEGMETDNDIFIINETENVMEIDKTTPGRGDIKVSASWMQRMRLNEIVLEKMNCWLPDKIIKLS